MELKKGAPLTGELMVPADKSISHRAVMFGAISHGKTIIKNFLRAQDCMSTVHAFESLGVSIEDDGQVITVEGKGFEGLSPSTEPINVGNSGTTIRLLMGLLSKTGFETTLFGDDSLNKRPMDRVIDPLKEMGAVIEGSGPSLFPPVTIKGQHVLKPIDHQMAVASAQVKSAILFAAIQAKGTSHIIEKERSRNHTEEMIKQFGGEISVSGKEIFISGPQKLVGKEITVPGDISSAAFFIAAATLVKDSSITLKNVGVNPTRTGILEVLDKMGAKIKVCSYDKINQACDLQVEAANLLATTISGELIPRLIDELPIIALLSTQAKGTTIISDAQELKVKETNRIDATVEELKKMGADIEATEDGLIIHGPTPLHKATVSSRGDHRIGMMLQVAALVADGPVILQKSEAVAISYPNFFNDMSSLLSETGE